MILPTCSFALENILILLAKRDSGKLRCPATAIIHDGVSNLFYEISISDDKIHALTVSGFKV